MNAFLSLTSTADVYEFVVAKTALGYGSVPGDGVNFQAENERTRNDRGPRNADYEGHENPSEGTEAPGKLA